MEGANDGKRNAARIARCPRSILRRLQHAVEAHLSTSTRLRDCIECLLKGSFITKSTILQHISLVMFLPHIILSDFRDTIPGFRVK